MDGYSGTLYGSDSDLPAFKHMMVTVFSRAIFFRIGSSSFAIAV